LWTGAENLAPTGIRSPDRPARTESLYGLSYPGTQTQRKQKGDTQLNPINTELNPICNLLALLAHHILHVSRVRVKAAGQRVWKGEKREDRTNGGCMRAEVFTSTALQPTAAQVSLRADLFILFIS